MLVEVGEEIGVREMEEARRIVSHHVSSSRDEETPRAVPMEALVSASFVTQ